MKLRVFVIGLAVAAALVPLPRATIERWYSQGIYPDLQSALTSATNQIPIALLDVAVALMVALVIWRFVRRPRSTGVLRTAGAALISLLTLSASIYLVFLLFWGLNYRRVPLKEKIDYDPSRVTAAAALQLARDSVARVNALHAQAHAATPAGPSLEDAFRAAQDRLGARRHAVPGVPKGSLLETYFRWAAIDGMTDPFFLEIIVNPDVLPFERPFVLAHEWAHLAGYADESEANLVAWLTCLDGNAAAQYSGWLAIYSHILESLPRDERRAIAKQLDAGPRQDLEAVSARFARSAPVVRDIARDTYDAYLKANRVGAGVASYDQVIELILGAGAERGWAPRAKGH